jgi:hypothetical protein
LLAAAINLNAIPFGEVVNVDELGRAFAIQPSISRVAHNRQQPRARTGARMLLDRAECADAGFL